MLQEGCVAGAGAGGVTEQERAVAAVLQQTPLKGPAQHAGAAVRGVCLCVAGGNAASVSVSAW